MEPATIQPDLFTEHAYEGITAESKQAAQLVLGISGSMRRQVFDCIARHQLGRTDPEIEQSTGMKGSTERPRRRELEQAGLIYKSDMRRDGCAVWMLTELGREVAK